MTISELILEVQSTIEDIRGDNECQRCGGSGYIVAFSHVDSGRCFECYYVKTSQQMAESKAVALKVLEEMVEAEAKQKPLPSDPEPTNHQGLTADELGLVHHCPPCDEAAMGIPDTALCWAEAAGERGVDW